MSKKFINGLSDILISFKNNDGTYTTPVKLDGSKTAGVEVLRDIHYIESGRGQNEEAINRIKEINISCEIYSPSTDIIGKMEGLEKDANGGLKQLSHSKSPSAILMIVRTDNFNKREFMILYNCKCKILDSLIGETKSNNDTVKNYILVAKSTPLETGLIRYIVKEDDLPNNSNFAEQFYKEVYFPS